jgi:predicted ATPase
MEPQEADAAIRLAAREYASRSESPRVLWLAFQFHLQDLCRDGPLTGDFLRLFQAFEQWEQSVSPEREQAENEIRYIAASLGDGDLRSP